MMAITGRKAILVPIDFSETSRTGLIRAAALAREIDAKLILLHVFEFEVHHYSPSFPCGRHTDEIVKLRNDQLRELADTWAPGAECSTVVMLHGTPDTAIVDYAGRIGAEIIVMGTHGRSGLTHLLLGSTAERVVRHAGCPVMTIGPSFAPPAAL